MSEKWENLEEGRRHRTENHAEKTEVEESAV